MKQHVLTVGLLGLAGPGLARREWRPAASLSLESFCGTSHPETKINWHILFTPTCLPGSIQ